MTVVGPETTGAFGVRRAAGSWTEDGGERSPRPARELEELGERARGWLAGPPSRGHLPAWRPSSHGPAQRPTWAGLSCGLL